MSSNRSSRLIHYRARFKLFKRPMRLHARQSPLPCDHRSFCRRLTLYHKRLSKRVTSFYFLFCQPSLEFRLGFQRFLQVVFDLFDSKAHPAPTACHPVPNVQTFQTFQKFKNKYLTGALARFDKTPNENFYNRP
jgi:hypothetical protein